MVKDITAKWLGRTALPVAIVTLMGLYGCATTGGQGAGELAVTQEATTAIEAAEASNAIKAISITADGSGVVIDAQRPVTYTVFRLFDPGRLVVDLPDVDSSGVASPIKVDNDYITDVTVFTTDENGKRIGRVVVGLKDGVEHRVKSGDSSLLVSLAKGPGAPSTVAQSNGKNGAKEPIAQEAGKPAEATVAKETVQVVASTSTLKPYAPAKAEKKKLKPAKNLVNVEAYSAGEDTVIVLTADGAMGAHKSFDLKKPARFVVDVAKVANAVAKKTLSVGDDNLDVVRVGTHSGRTRVVFDFKSDAITPHAITSQADRLVIAFGPTASKTAALKSADKEPEAKPVKVEKTAEPASVTKTVEAKPAVAPAVVEPAKVEPAVSETAKTEAPKAESVKSEPAVVEAAQAVAPAPVSPAAVPDTAPKPAQVVAEAGKVLIEKIDFRKLNGSKARLTVLSTGKVGYSIKESADGKTIILDVTGAVLPDELSRTLDATKLKTPVATISSYQESTEPISDVRLLIKLVDKARYEVKEYGSALNVDFEEAPKAAEAPVKAEAPKAEALLEAVAAPGEFTGQKIDLDMMDANVSDVLRLLAEVSNLNIIASDDVRGTISLRLKSVPWDQALDIVLKSKDLGKTLEGNVMRIAPASKIRQERADAAAEVKSSEKLEDLLQEFLSVSYAVASDMVAQIKPVLSDRGSVTSETRTNTLIVTDIKKGIERAKALVTKLDTPTPQVLIEARIVEASTSFARDLGIQWGIDVQTGTSSLSNIFGSTEETGATGGVSNYAVNLPATGTAGTLGALGFTLGKAGSSPLVLDLRLSAGEKEGRLKTISRPRITTLDNKEAKIEQGESIPFETTSTAGTATTFIDANLSLTVTPHITPDGSVLMKIRASRNSIGTFRTSSGEPSINKKESSTEVLVRDGETTVIGGIVISDQSESESGIPYLRDVPLIGSLFKSKSVSDSQTELLIFITPTIIKEKEKVQG